MHAAVMVAQATNGNPQFERKLQGEAVRHACFIRQYQPINAYQKEHGISARQHQLGISGTLEDLDMHPFGCLCFIYE